MIMIAIILSFSVSEWGVVDLGSGKVISSATAFGELIEDTSDMPVVKAPVLYFYGNISKELVLSLGVSPDKITVSEPPFVEINGKPSWRIRQCDPKKASPEPSCWTDQKATAILANEHACGYIFYEAQVSYENKVRILREGDKMGFLNSGKHPVYDIIYLIGYPGAEKGILLSYYIPILGPSETIWPEPAGIPSESEIRRNLVSAGLTEGAAEAFLGEWWPVFTLQRGKEEPGPWFQEGSLITSAFAYRLSEEEVEEILPLSIKPKPEKLERAWWVLMR